MNINFPVNEILCGTKTLQGFNSFRDILLLKAAQEWKVRGRDFTQIRSVWIGELETRPKLQKINGWGLLFLSAKYFFAVSATSLKMFCCLATSKKKLF